MLTQQLIKVPRDQCDYPSQPRSQIDQDYCLRLGQNMLAHGQKVPVIGYFKGKRFILCEGGCRLVGAGLVGISELLALDLGNEPTHLELLVAQACIDLHRQHLQPIDRAQLLRAIHLEQGCSSRELAESLNVSEGFVSRALALLELPENIQKQINEGTLDASRGYVLSQESDPVRQQELAAQAMSISREELARRVRRSKGQATPQVRARRIAFPLPSGVKVAVSGEELSLDDFIDALGEAQKEAKKARDQSLDAKTFAAVMRDKAKRP